MEREQVGNEDRSAAAVRGFCLVRLHQRPRPQRSRGAASALERRPCRRLRAREQRVRGRVEVAAARAGRAVESHGTVPRGPAPARLRSRNTLAEPVIRFQLSGSDQDHGRDPRPGLEHGRDASASAGSQAVAQRAAARCAHRSHRGSQAIQPAMATPSAARAACRGGCATRARTAPRQGMRAPPRTGIEVYLVPALPCRRGRAARAAAQRARRPTRA